MRLSQSAWDSFASGHHFSSSAEKSSFFHRCRNTLAGVPISQLYKHRSPAKGSSAPGRTIEIAVRVTHQLTVRKVAIRFSGKGIQGPKVTSHVYFIHRARSEHTAIYRRPVEIPGLIDYEFIT